MPLMPSNANREPPWLCVQCGYLMDASSSTTGMNRLPNHGDVSLCLNCAAIYRREASRWRPITDKELKRLSAGAVLKIVVLTRQILNKGAPDLTTRDGRA